MLQLRTMLEKEMLLWKSFISLENIFRVESGTKIHFPRFKTQLPLSIFLFLTRILNVAG